MFWRIRGHLSEGREWLARLLDAVPIDGPPRERARGLANAALLAIPQGDYATGKRLLQESLALLREIDDPNSAARALGNLSYLSICQGDYPEAEALARESMDLARATGTAGCSTQTSASWLSRCTRKANGLQRASCTSGHSQWRASSEGRGQ